MKRQRSTVRLQRDERLQLAVDRGIFREVIGEEFTVWALRMLALRRFHINLLEHEQALGHTLPLQAGLMTFTLKAEAPDMPLVTCAAVAPCLWGWSPVGVPGGWSTREFKLEQDLCLRLNGDQHIIATRTPRSLQVAPDRTSAKRANRGCANLCRRSVVVELFHLGGCSSAGCSVYRPL